MSDRALIDKLQRFKGKQIIDCSDEIKRLACADGFSVNIMDPEFNTPSIDNEPTRLNVRTDRQSVITSFTIG